MRKECRWARRRARAAEKHRAVVGAYPRRIRVAKLNRAPRDGAPYTPMKPSPMFLKFISESTESGGLAFHAEDSRRPDVEFVPVAYDVLKEGTLDELDKQMKLIAKGKRKRGAPQQKKERR